MLRRLSSACDDGGAGIRKAITRGCTGDALFQFLASFHGCTETVAQGASSEMTGLFIVRYPLSIRCRARQQS
jgi:hypothetical protein